MDDSGPRMVDIGAKPSTRRRAVASGHILLSPKAYELVTGREVSKKGSVLAVAQLAAVMAAKQTPHLIPLCHSLLITNVEVNFDLQDSDCCVGVRVCVECEGGTGVEMEALCATSLALLTVYDMTKSVSHEHTIEGICLEEKSGGASGHWTRS